MADIDAPSEAKRTEILLQLDVEYSRTESAYKEIKLKVHRMENEIIVLRKSMADSEKAMEEKKKQIAETQAAFEANPL